MTRLTIGGLEFGVDAEAPEDLSVKVYAANDEGHITLTHSEWLSLQSAASTLADAERVSCLLSEATQLGYELGAIGLDLVNGRAPSISTSEMVRSRLDRVAAIRREHQATELAAAKGER